MFFCWSHQRDLNGGVLPEVPTIATSQKNDDEPETRSLAPVIAPRSRPGSPGGAPPAAWRFLAGAPDWRRRTGPVDGPRPVFAIARTSSPRRCPAARRFPPARRRSRPCLRGRAARLLDQQQVIAQREPLDHPFVCRIPPPVFLDRTEPEPFLQARRGRRARNAAGLGGLQVFGPFLLLDVLDPLLDRRMRAGLGLWAMPVATGFKSMQWQSEDACCEQDLADGHQVRAVYL